MFHLRYVGDGEHYVIGYPTADIEVEDLDETLGLLQTELYEVVEGAVQDQPTDAPADAGSKE